MNRGKLYGVSVGPGDPELLTLKAVRVIREADVVAVPDIGHKRQTAYGIAREYLEGKRILDCSTPMSRDRQAVLTSYRAIADKICELLDAGEDVAYLTLGDATVYSTYMYVHDLVLERGYEAQIIPGVTSFCAAAARLGRALCEGSEQLHVVPVIGADLDAVLDLPGSKVFMKAGRELGVLRDALAERGQLEQASLVANCGLPDERVHPRFADADPAADYFSVVVVKESKGDADATA
ncbi:MAG: precorrin-2 C(20)-methyltransferase [Coriobacteriaceae bacterium]|nr:precorrin-2 C(20)-methyltransferase [Coriobacteriaceae bacterium]